MKALLDEYRRSLKMKEAEEVCDLLVYRPIAFVFVKAINRLPITPNHVTVLSLAVGLLAAWNFSCGFHNALVWAAVWFFVANVLDCADGQLARLQNSGTLLGRVVDGVIDYIISVAVFLGIGFGMEKTGNGEWLVVLIAGVSGALHAVAFDYYQNEYIATKRGEQHFLEREREKFIDEIVTMQRERRDGVKIFFLQLYLHYLKLQQYSMTKQDGSSTAPEQFQEQNRLMIRLWSFLGLTTNRTLLILTSFFGNVAFYLWIVATVGNAWLLMCYVLQKRAYRRTSSVV